MYYTRIRTSSAVAAGALMIGTMTPGLAVAEGIPGGMTIRVDDDAPGDPGPGDCGISDPLEDGTPAHPFDCIQEAIDAAANGDEILVADGLYTGPGNKNLDYAGKRIAVRSENGPESCVIDCEGDGRGFYFHSGEILGAVVDGLGIINGAVTAASPGGNAGAGIHCSGAGPRISNCRLIGGLTAEGAAGWGAGIYLSGANAVTIQDCVLDGNVVSSSAGTGGHGGGVCAIASIVRIEGCMITNNRSGMGTGAEDGGRGGGVYAEDGALWIERTMLADNVARIGGIIGGGGDGGGVAVVDAVVTIADCDLERNSTESTVKGGHGAGLYLADCLGGVLFTDFVDNATSAGASGGGINANGGSLTVDTCLFTGNSATDGGAVFNQDGLQCISASIFDGNRARRDGGGLCTAAGAPLVEGSTFRNNEAGTDGAGNGGGADCAAGSPVFHGCAFEANTAATAGGGLRVAGTATAEGCTFTGNEATDPEGGGGGVAVAINGAATLVGTTPFVGNTAVLGAGLKCRGVLSVNVGASSADGPGMAVLQGEDAFLNLGQLRLGTEAAGFVHLVIEMPFQQRGAAVAGSVVFDVGATAGQHDRLEFTQTQTFDGAMQVRLAAAFPEDDGTTYEVITGPALFGQFDIVQLPGRDDRVMTVSYPGAGGDGPGMVTINVDTFGIDSDYGVGEFFDIPIGTPTDMVLDRFNEDDFVDVALTLSGGPGQPGNLVVLFNSGAQSGDWLGFSGAFQFPAGIAPSGITSGRFVKLAADQQQGLEDLTDIAVTNAGNGEVWVYTNRLRRLETFTLSAVIDVGEAPSSLTAYDLVRNDENDDTVDIAVTNFGDGVGPGSLELLVNDGDGGFVSMGELPLRVRTLRVDPTEIDDDKFLDLLVMHASEEDEAPSLAVLIADGQKLLAPRYFETDPGSVELVSADLDGDGEQPLDVVTANFTAGTISILKNLGGVGADWNGFAPAVNLPVAQAPRSIAASDVNLDGRLDIALIVDEPTVVQVIRNEGQNTFTALPPIADESSPKLIRAADIDNNGLDDLVTVGGGAPGVNGGGTNVGVRLNETCVPFDEAITTVFVDGTAAGDGTGASWQDAVIDLRAALCRAALSPNVTQMYVAEGTYTPAPPNGDREIAFALVDGLAIYGGFPSGGGIFEMRDPAQFETILSGDLKGDDETGGSNADNSHNVVIAFDVGAETVLDGFTITRGNGNVSADRFARGGGIFMTDADPLISNCRIVDNAVITNAGGVYMRDSAPTFVSCAINRNTTDINGDSPAGGLNLICSTPILINCEMRENTSQRGGGFSESNSCPLLINCLIADNAASEFGGAVTSGQFSGPTFLNCTVVNNTAPEDTGGLWFIGGLATVTIKNTIVWGNSGVPDDPQIFINPAGGGVNIVIDQSAVERCDERVCDPFSEGGDAWCCDDGIGNIVDDPMFVDFAGGDFRLASGSPCVDAGSSWGLSASPAGLGGVCDRDDIDGDGDTAELIPLDFAGAPRFADDLGTVDTGCGPTVVVDMGIFERGEPDLDSVYYADIDGNGAIGFGDVLNVLATWGACMAETCCVSDLDGDGAVGFAEILILLQNFDDVGGSCVDHVLCAGRGRCN